MARRKGGRKIPQRIKDEKEFEAFRNQPATIEAVMRLVMRLEVEIKERLINLEKRLDKIDGEKKVKKALGVN